MNLFQVKDYKLEINPAAYSVYPFKKIWDRDKSKNKKRAIEELSYIYFMCDYKSDFADIIDEEEKHTEIVKSCMQKEKYEPDKVVQEAMDFYVDRQETLTMRLYRTAKIGISKIEKYIESIDLKEKDKKTGKPIHNISQINSVIKELVNTADTLEKLETRIKSDLQQKDFTARGNREKAVFEDGI